MLAAALLLLLAAMGLKDGLIRLPSPPATPTAEGFDANRAATRLARILGDQRPHPVDSPASDAVLGRLLAEMRGVGLQPQVRDAMTCNPSWRTRAVLCARVRNVVATIGPSRGPHVLLSTHHDSTFAGPGAADAGIGVATLLETAAALRGRPLRRPVTFLVNDGEEMGLIGARAFLEHDPLAPRVGALLNFEARGVNGPAIMFETSRPNAAAIAHFARASDRPVANSLTTDLYRLIPNDTDVSVYRERPWTILNYSNIGNETRYHSAGDTMAALDRRSLQHMGAQALAATLELANGEPPQAAGERIYADLLGLQLVHLPLLFGLALLGILLLFFLVRTWRREAYGRALLAMAAGIVGAIGLAWVGQLLLGLVRSGAYWRAYPWVTELAVYGSALAACLAAMVLIGSGSDRTRLRAAYWLLFLVAGAGLSAIAPGASIFFLLPPLVAALGMALEGWVRGAERAGAILAALLLFLTFAPPLGLFEELMSSGPHWIFAPLGAAILLPALIEVRPLIVRVPRAFALAGAADLFLLPWIAVALTPAYSDDRQQLFTVEYVRDTGTNQALWSINNDGAPVPFSARWTRSELPFSLRKRWTTAAPSLPLEPPQIEVIERQIVEGGRRLQLRLRTNGAEAAVLIGPGNSGLRSAGIGGSVQRFIAGRPDERYFIRCTGRSCDGATLDLFTTERDPIEFHLIGTRTGLPPQAAALVRARPRLARPQYLPDSTITISKIRL